MHRWSVRVFMAFLIVALNSPTYAVLDDFEDGDYTNNPTWTVWNVGYGTLSVAADPVRPGNSVVKIHGTEEAHFGLRTLMNMPYAGFDASVEFLTADALDYHPVLSIGNGNVAIVLGLARDYYQYGHLFPTLYVGEGIGGANRRIPG